MQDALKTYLAMANGLTEVSRKRAKAAAKKLAKQGGSTVEQVQTLTDDLLSTSRANRESLTTLVRYEIDRALGAVGLATVDEVQNLTTRIHELEAELRLARAQGVTADRVDADAPREARVAAAEARAVAAEAKESGRGTAAKKAPAKKATQPVLPEVAGSTAAPVAVTPDPAKALPETAGATPDGQVPGKAVPGKTAAKKTPAKKSPAKKVAAKKAPAKKAASPQAIATKPASREVEEQVAEVKARKVAKLPATNPATATSESGGTEL
jgi:polyhydroxyalkanoate synthesis regulator phasin